MLSRKKNNVVWITGASRGIGAALAREYASKENSKLILSAPASEIADLNKVANDCQGITGHENLVLPFDLTDNDDINRAYDLAIAKMKKIDVLVNNAGITHRSDILDTDLKIYDILTKVNYLGPVALTKKVLPDMVARKQGQIVINCSINGIIPTPHRAAYIGAKHAMHGWSESLRDEMVKHGIKVTTVFPGFINTGIGAHALTGTGDKHGKTGSQENGISPEELAKIMVKGAKKGKKRMLVAGKEGLLVPLKKVSPDLVSKIVRSVNVT